VIVDSRSCAQPPIPPPFRDTVQRPFRFAAVSFARVSTYKPAYVGTTKERGALQVFKEGTKPMHRPTDEDEFAETRTLNGSEGIAPVTNLDSWRNAKQMEERAERLYQAYLKVCEQAGLKPNPPKHSK
jgi:hypothetical protein